LRAGAVGLDIDFIADLPPTFGDFFFEFCVTSQMTAIKTSPQNTKASNASLSV
jgi:hypothetical protein